MGNTRSLRKVTTNVYPVYPTRISKKIIKVKQNSNKILASKLDNSFSYKLLTKSQSEQVKNDLPLDCESYRWLEARKTNDSLNCILKCFPGLITAHFRIRPRMLWNSKGREIYSRKSSLDIASAITEIFKSLESFEWYCEPCNLKYFEQLLKYIPRTSKRYRNQVKMNEINFGFNLRKMRMPILFNRPSKNLIAMLLETPYFLGANEIFFCSTKVPLMFVFSDHLDIEVRSNSQSLLKKVERIFVKSRVKLGKII